jgi:hypothetical protein
MIMAVLNLTTTGTVIMWDGNSTNVGASTWTATNGWYVYAGSTGKATPIVSLTNQKWYVYELLINGSTSSLSLNKATRSIVSAGTANMGGFTLGSSGGNTYLAPETVSELILMNRDFITSERDWVHKYLNRWGVY